MKKMITVVALVVIALVAAQAEVLAITGPCSGCHTMHNSQNGQAVNGQVNGRDFLLIGDCLACHTNNGTTGPQVDTAYNNAAMPASGTFNEATDSHIHNLPHINTGIFTNVDGDLAAAPGGGTVTPANLTCAGTNGCHGTPTVAEVAPDTTGFAAMSGYHHGNPATVGYRFLKTAANAAILGTGHADWERGGALATRHNVYAGNASSAATSQSISSLCGRCHPNFHLDANTGGPATPFTRHPTDHNIPQAWGITVDYVTAPVAFADVTGQSTTAAYTIGYTGATDTPQVMCLTCHRAHGSNQPDLLRFDYATQQAGNGGTTGCLACHTTQR